MWNKYTLIVGEIHFLGSILQILTKFTIFCICKDKIAKKKKQKKKLLEILFPHRYVNFSSNL